MEKRIVPEMKSSTAEENDKLITHRMLWVQNMLLLAGLLSRVRRTSKLIEHSLTPALYN